MANKYHINSPNNSVPRNLTTEILNNHDALEFHKSLPEYSPTPLIELPGLSDKHKVGKIYIKDESKRFGLNAFKGLGASFALHQTLLKEPDIECFCTATDGNHGRAVAWSAKRNGKKSVVFVPQDTTAKRIEAIESAGAKVIQINGNYDEACNEAEVQSQRNDWVLIQDTAWDGYIEIPALIMSGYITMFKELENSLHTMPTPKIDVVFLQAGVGSMAAAGVFYYLNRYAEVRPKIVIVEPEQADGILYSFQRGKISTSIGNSKTIMAGLNCETPSLGAWDILKNGADYLIKISDSYVVKAMQALYFPTGSDTRIVSGESGAAGLAGFLAILYEREFRPIKDALKLSIDSEILFVNTEGDTDKEIFNAIIKRETVHNKN